MGVVSLALLGLLLFSGLAQAVVRTYYIAAEEVEWDYLPSNKDQFRGVDYMLSKHARVFCEQGDDRIGKVYRKAMYFEYTDASFTQKVARPNWMGFLGPAIRAEVGDTIEVHFVNKATLAYSIHPHGVFYDKNNEGALYADGTKDTTGDAIFPGKNYTYKWEVRERSGPGPNDMSSILWSYHSHVLESQDIYSGLIGPMIIYRKGTLGSNGLPVGIDREYILLLMVFDENQSRYISTNIKNYCGKPDTVDTGDDDFVESNLMHGINGYFYCNLNDMFMCEGETVRWYTFAFGTEVDLHTVHWHGQTLLMDGHRMDVLELLPATMRTLDMTVDNPGNWLIHCHVNDHAAGGMQAYFQVATKDQCDAGYKAWL